MAVMESGLEVRSDGWEESIGFVVESQQAVRFWRSTSCLFLMRGPLVSDHQRPEYG
jgi:hypothetical protein